MFDGIGQDDLIIAFFPCVRFENQIMLWFRGHSNSQKDWELDKKMQYDMDLIDEVRNMYHLVNKLFLLCLKKGLRLIMENPYSEEHFLRRYWCFLPSVIDRDRRTRGDYFKKPTQYWFLNCEPENNFIFEVVDNNEINTIEFVRKKDLGCNLRTARSMIHPQYANRFIREFILDGEV